MGEMQETDSIKALSDEQNLHEAILESWLNLTLAISNEKIVSDMTYNEALICNLLYSNQRKTPHRRLTATDLCELTKMQKSQMNRTLTGMEEKHLIVRERSDEDKRQIFVSLDENKDNIYQHQHKKILKIVDSIVEKLGIQKSREVMEIFNMIAHEAKEVIQ